VPRDVTHVIVDKSVEIIPSEKFFKRRRLVSIKMHDGMVKIDHSAFYECVALAGGIKLPGVKSVEAWAFSGSGLTNVEFGDKLETIRKSAFSNCHSLRDVKVLTARSIEAYAFSDCHHLTDLELPEVKKIRKYAFIRCTRLRRVAVPLKYDLLDEDNIFHYCKSLTTVNLLGGIHKTISSLYMESWRNEMNAEIASINQVLPNTQDLQKTRVIQQWIESVLGSIEHFKMVHCILLKEALIVLELAIWKAKLDENGEEKLQLGATRNELNITSGASIVIENVLPFLALE